MSVAKFRKLHAQSSPLLLGNVWDAHSAKLAEKTGFEALGSSSHAIANALGYEDGENISFEELFFIVERIVKAVSIPVSVDFEAGYAQDPEQVAKHVKMLTNIGVVGINLEDGVVKDGKRVLGPEQDLTAKIKAIKKETDIFINARTDTYTTKHPSSLKESISRALTYQDAGADGLFVPLLIDSAEIKKFTDQVKLPLNIFLTPDLPDYERLGALGVKRLSHGGQVYGLIAGKVEELFQSYKSDKVLPKQL